MQILQYSVRPGVRYRGGENDLQPLQPSPIATNADLPAAGFIRGRKHIARRVAADFRSAAG